MPAAVTSAPAPAPFTMLITFWIFFELEIDEPPNLIIFTSLNFKRVKIFNNYLSGNYLIIKH